MRIFDLSEPFFAPLWRRVVIVAVCIGWGVLELAAASSFWGFVFLVTGIYCAWVFFISGPYATRRPGKDPKA
ncbi:DUF3329 domain-containing protein [Algicella marina]|uniref:DUF3329 domain-containing protein n=1 Tax=Algicella marina TaxID=2683284 RepID=A0A6P1T3D5_9RHOB|nr:DUF3329 domain-containing protein [Algicella marina]QHQ35022.1 DUF3329 domain-containing protein [Algicella marina]